MVILSFKLQVEAPYEQVWSYFKMIQNVPQWDPNMKKTEVVKKTPDQIGSQYKLTSQMYGVQSVIDYQTTRNQQTKDHGCRRFQGRNSKISAKDEARCSKLSQSSTIVQWKVDMTLRGFYWMFTPIGYLGFKKLERDGRQGCLKRLTQLFGKAKQIQ